MITEETKRDNTSFALCMKTTVVNNFSLKNITRYANKVNKKVIAYQAIVGYIYKIE